MKQFILIACLLYSISSQSQNSDSILIMHSDWKFGMQSQNFYFLNNSGDTILKLDSSKYLTCESDTFKHFAIVSFKGKSGWWAIDRSERVLFEVLNASLTEPAPDELQEGFIRIINEKRQIGFANEKGKIVITPQFEWVTAFHKGKAIFGNQCKTEPMMMDGKISKEHLEIKCRKYGYINKQGKIKNKASNTFDELAKIIGWR